MGRKNYIILFLAFIVTGVTVLFSAMGVSAVEVEDVLPKATSGYAGYFNNFRGVGRKENIEWTYDTTTKTLTFSGSGDMATNESADDIANKSDLKSEMLERLGTWYIWHKEAEHIVIGEGITDIGYFAFLNFTKLKDVSIPDSVLYIKAGAFKNTALNSVVIPRSVKSIGYSAFEKAWLKEVTIENGVREIDVGAFRSNQVLEEIIFPESVKFVTYNSDKYDIGEGILDGCYNLKKVTLPSTITAIPACFCLGCHNLKTITLPHSVERIGRYAFYGCSGLETISFPQSLKKIEECAFQECSGLEKVILPQSLKTIEKCAFQECSSLKKVILPQSLKKIEESTFAETGLKSIKLPESLKEIRNGAFSDTSLKSIKLPKSLEKIEGDVFSGTFLKTIEIPKNVKVLGHHWCGGIFSNSKKLRTVKIKSRKLKKVYNIAFDNFPSKATIVVPKGKKKSYSKMFYKAGLSKKVKIKESKTW